MSLVIAHAAATWFMVGLIWTVQSVHYPLFARIGPAEFVEYERGHTTRIGRLLVVPAGTEVLTAALLVVAAPPAITPALIWFGGGLLAAAWIITALVQAPLHARLSRRHDPAGVVRLVRTNWWRTVLWSGRAVVAATMVAQVAAT